MHSPKISVIVPIYNAEAYLRHCIESILTQTFIDFELLLIDDGSPDNCNVICDELALKDSRVRVFHQPNGGVTSARKLGIEKCKRGGYVMFVDADDELPSTALEVLYDGAEGGKYDIVHGCVNRQSFSIDYLSVTDYRSVCISGNIVSCAPFAKIIKRELFDDKTLNIPRSIPKGEDMLMNIRLAFTNQKTVRLINKVVYHYLHHTESCINTFKSNQEYETLYHRYRMMSIPFSEVEKYQREIITTRLSALKAIAFVDPSDVVKITSFKTQLVEDIEKIDYKLDVFSQLLLTCKVPAVIRLFIGAIRMSHKLRKVVCKQS